MAALSVHSFGDGINAGRPAPAAYSLNLVRSRVLRATPPHRTSDLGSVVSAARLRLSMSERATISSKLARKSARHGSPFVTPLSRICFSAAVLSPLKLKSRLRFFVRGRANRNFRESPARASRSMIGPPG